MRQPIKLIIKKGKVLKDGTILNIFPKEYGDLRNPWAELREKLMGAEKLVDYALKNVTVSCSNFCYYCIHTL